ncbi:FAD binding domain-containing protein [Demequina sp. SYSU T00192]|uniref:FAD binding domain-containing protein n=1 Tax=Demequina litoralis TaxID=3051660 RepID=A0ABT8G6J0_9MICO|nr:FAD binding domain-containing protein [Demequina sp. SYSU T00192]MDN4474755.1 FAD binding domain-containing protein [Demequina sp. SYSU T00192]
MDLSAVTGYRVATSRADLALAPGERFLAGGTWLFSEPNRDVTGLVDLAGLPGPRLEVTRDGLIIGATCTIAELLALPPHLGWAAQPLFADAANALLASFKIWNEATVVGNICRGYSAAAMLAACVTLDAEALVWTADGDERIVPVASLPTGNGTTTLAHGDLVREVRIPADALRARTALRKIALAELGRSGAVVTGRAHPDGRTVIVVTAATLTPTVLRYAAPPDPATARDDARAAAGYYTDALGAADWRRHVSGVLAAEVAEELA